MSANKGFSLMEIIVVIIIVGVLVTVAVPNYTSSIQQSRISNVENNLMAISAAQQKSFEDISQYYSSPTDNNGNDFLGINTGLKLSLTAQSDSFYYNCSSGACTASYPSANTNTATCVITVSTKGNITTSNGCGNSSASPVCTLLVCGDYNTSCGGTYSDGCGGTITCGAPVICNTPPNTQCYSSSGTCSNGVCGYTPKTGASCNDGNPCDVNDQCNNSGNCVGTPMTCSTPPNNQCYSSSGSCSGGSCSYTKKISGTSCNDGNVCDVGAQCNSSGACVGGTCATTTYNCNVNLSLGPNQWCNGSAPVNYSMTSVFDTVPNRTAYLLSVCDTFCSYNSPGTTCVAADAPFDDGFVTYTYCYCYTGNTRGSAGSYAQNCSVNP